MTDDISSSDLLSCAIDAARAAGNHALTNRHRRNDSIQKTDHDIKLALDVECQQIATDVILSSYPSHSILGEETPAPGPRTTDDGLPPHGQNNLSSTNQEPQASGQNPSEKGREGSRPSSVVRSPVSPQWIIDPIDGTVNFAHGLAWWCCSVAVRNDNQMLAGAVYAPAMNEFFTASSDGPALLNEEPITVSKRAPLSEAMIATGMDRDIPGQEPFAVVKRVAYQARKARVMGSAAYDICQVACGRSDGYYETGIYIWDIAAAGLITQRAGGKADILAYQDNEYRLLFLATNGLIHDELRSLITP